MSRRANPTKGSGPKVEREQQDALRKEQYGFANLAKEQQFRSTTQGDIRALNDKLRELTDMLEDRKNANRLLVTENQRLKKMCADLQVQLLDKPTARGESAALKSMRDMARQFQNREQMTSAAAEKLISELMGQNQVALDEMQRLGDDRDGLMAELRTTQEALSSASSEVAAYREQLAAMAEEKETLLAEKEEQAQQAQQLDEQRQQIILKLEGEVEALKQQLAERDAAAEAARVAAEAALRSQKAALEAEALLQRKAAVAEVQAQADSLKQLLHKAHESLRALNQTEALGPGWTVMERGLQVEGSLEQRPENELAPPPDPLAVAVATATASRRSRRSSRAGDYGTGDPGAAVTNGPAGRHSAAASVTGSLQLERSGNAGHEGAVAAAAGSPVQTRIGSVAASVLGRNSARPSEAGSGGDGGGNGAVDDADATVPTGERNDTVEEPASAGGDGGELAVEASEDVGGGGRSARVDGEQRNADGVAAEVEIPGVRDGGGSRAASVAGSVELKSKQQEAVASEPARNGEGRPAAGTSGDMTASMALTPAAPSGPRGNVLELLLHDATLHPGAIGLPASELWALMRLSCPGLPGLTHLALSPPESGSGSGSGSQQLPLLCAVRLHFPDDTRLLTAVAGGAARVLLQNLRSAVVGAFGCPRVVQTPNAPPAAPAASSGSGGNGVRAVADGTLERVLVVASRDEYNCPSLELYCMDEEGRPIRPFQLLSTPWRQQLSDSIPQPRSDEVCIDTQALHRLQADAARASGLFDLSALRVFIGRTDGHTYQVWRLADVEARRKASFKALGRVLVELAEDPWVGAAPLATASLPLTAALSSPTLTRLELANVKLLLGDQPMVRLYEPSDDIATQTLACRTIAGEKLVATVRITARLARDPEVSEQLLAALQPALQVGAGAPALPPLHWLSLLGAEELVLERLLRELRGGVGAAAGRLMALPAHDDVSAAEVEALGRQAEDAILLKERQLVEGLNSCQVIVAAAATASPQESTFARAHLQQTRRRVARTWAEVTAFFRQRLELYRLGAVAWHFITEAAGSDDPVARLPVTTTRPQAKNLADVLQALAAALQALAPQGATSGELLPASAPLALLLPPPPAAPPLQAAAAAAATQTAPVAYALADAARELEAALRASVDAAAVAAEQAFEELRKQVAVPGSDDISLVEAAQVRLATLAAPVTAALVGGMAGLCQAAVAASLAEQETVATLREQLLAGAVAAAVGAPPPLQLSTAGMHLVAQLTMQLGAQADAAAAMTGAVALATSISSAGPGSQPPPKHDAVAAAAAVASAAAPQLSAALRSLQWLVGALTRAAPAPIAASPHSVGAWAKASVRLRLQLGVVCTAWSAAAVAAAGHALLLCGQRHAAVGLALEVMGREVDRVLDATKATLESLRANRSYDETVLADCMPPIATELTSHVAAAVTSCFWLAAQMVLTPLVVQLHMTPPPPPPPNRTPDDTQHHPGPIELIASSGPQDPAAAATAQGLSSSNGSSSSSSSSSSGSCYSSSLHVSSCVTFTIVTTGNLRVGGPVLIPATGPAAAAAGPQTVRPGEPSLAPLNQPLLTTWQPRRAVLYLDIARLNATAAAVAAAPGTDPPVASPPPAAMDTAALPHLPAALELLGWTLRHAEEFYHGHFAAGPPTEGGPLLTAAAAPLSKAPSAAPSTASTPRKSAIVPGGTGPSLRGSASVASSVSAPEDAPPPPTAALATDPLAALSEAKLAARMAEEVDVAVLAGGRLADAGSLIKWLSQNGMLVLVAADLQQLPEALAGISGGSSGDNNDNDNAAARALARTLVGLLATHHLQAATVRTLMQPLVHGAGQPASAANPRPGTRSSASTPRTSLSGKPGSPVTPLPPASTTLSAAAATATAASPTASGVQPLAVLTYLSDLALAKPALTVCNDLARRVDLALQALEAAAVATGGDVVASATAST
ncbi:hypothetical protein Vafri_4155 [Volvox africanus]|uniref:Uncharacterized protein n=2 Tax=Volvox africanus TaxID=51714 RepID=A0A8J4EUE5_9CHLO|nr:hypothetical protein Vafri_4155 [Volvox africanus]